MLAILSVLLVAGWAALATVILRSAAAASAALAGEVAPPSTAQPATELEPVAA
jgi:hypothetical protein